MDPVNKKEIQRSVMKFVLQFSFSIAVALVCIFLFNRASSIEYKLLKERNDEIENMISSRNEINQQFGLINTNFKELGTYSNSLSDMAKKRILQTEIAKSAGIISNIISKVESKNHRPSLELYKKMNMEVSNVSRLQDSLFSSKNMIESKRSQLNVCINENKRIEILVKEQQLRENGGVRRTPR